VKSFDDASITQDLNISDDAKRKLSLILGRCFTGSDTTLYAPYVSEERSADMILHGLDVVYEKHRLKVDLTLDSLELDINRPKFGPMSQAKAWLDGREETIQDSYVPAKPGDKVFKPFPLTTSNRLRPLCTSAAIDYLKNDSNGGFPSLAKKRDVKNSFRGYTLDDFAKTIKIYLDTGDLIEQVCSVLFTRTQELGKTRNVWGFAILVTIFEMLFYRPLLDVQSKQSWRAALRTPDDVNLAITNLIDFALRNGYYLLSIDFSRYDNSLKAGNILSAFECIIMAFQSKFSHYLLLIAHFFINVPIITPGGILEGPHGVPSGSTFTNEIDSIAQYGIARECTHIAGLPLSQVQGDDGAYACLDAEAVKSHFREYGLIVNDEKSYVAKNWLIYLQMLFHADYRDNKGIINGIYPIYRALNRIIHLETFEDFSEDNINGNDYFSIRTICILEQCKHHPLFEEFVTYVWSLDKYRLVYSEYGLANYIRRVAKKEGKDITFRNWSYGSDVSGLKGFACVRIIDELNNK